MFAAEHARVGLLAGMDHAMMPLQVTLPRKLLATFFAEKRTFSRVPAHVILQSIISSFQIE